MEFREASNSYYYYGGYGCDGRHIRGEDCHYKENHLTKRWRCNSCDYDLCLKCAYAMKTIDRSKVHEHQYYKDQYVLIWDHYGLKNAWMTDSRE